MVKRKEISPHGQRDKSQKQSQIVEEGKMSGTVYQTLFPAFHLIIPILIMLLTENTYLEHGRSFLLTEKERMETVICFIIH